MNKMTLCALALCALSVAACADRMNNGARTGSSDSMSSTSGSGGGYAPSNMTGPSGGTTSQAGQTSPSPTTTSQTSYGVVQAIDQMQRQDVGVGLVGAAAAGGMTGTPTDKVYRVTVRMDDGSSQMVVLDSAPSYKIGDRVRYNNGAVQAY